MDELRRGGGMKKRRCNDQKILLLKEDEENEEVDFGNDVLAQIIVRFPVEAVFRCKSVSKQWLDLISRRSFMGQYRKRWKKSLSSALFLQCQNPSGNEFLYIKLRPIRSRRFFVESTDEKEEQSDPKDPFCFYNQRGKSCLGFLPFSETNGRSIDVLASSNGLLLCRCFPELYYVCNPVTREWVVLSPPQNGHYINVRFLCFDTQSHTKGGDGSDSDDCQTCQFRVVLLTNRALNFLEFETFYSKTGQWKKHKVSVSHSPTRTTYFHYKTAVPCNGILYWAEPLKYGYPGNIVAYDPIAESCRFIPLPVGRTDPIAIQSLGEVTGQLRYARIYKTRYMPFTSRLMIWSLLDLDSDNNVANWSLEHNFDLNEMKIEHNVSLSSELIQRYISQATFHPLDGNVFFLGVRDKLITCNLELNRLERLCDLTEDSLHSIVPYIHMPWPNRIPQLS